MQLFTKSCKVVVEDIALLKVSREVIFRTASFNDFTLQICGSHLKMIS